MFEQELIAFLGTQTSVTTVVAKRIYPVVLPQNDTYPSVVYQMIDAPPERTLDGLKWTPARYQFTAYGKTYLSAKLTAAAITTLFDDFQGALVEDGDIISALVDSSRDMGYDLDTNTYRVDVDVIFSLV